MAQCVALSKRWMPKLTTATSLKIQRLYQQEHSECAYGTPTCELILPHPFIASMLRCRGSLSLAVHSRNSLQPEEMDESGGIPSEHSGDKLPSDYCRGQKRVVEIPLHQPEWWPYFISGGHRRRLVGWPGGGRGGEGRGAEGLPLPSRCCWQLPFRRGAGRPRPCQGHLGARYSSSSAAWLPLPGRRSSQQKRITRAPKGVQGHGGPPAKEGRPRRVSPRPVLPMEWSCAPASSWRLAYTRGRPAPPAARGGRGEGGGCAAEEVHLTTRSPVLS